MLRRRVGHDYSSRRIYLITMTVEGRRPLLGRLVGDASAPDDSPDAPKVELTPLGEQVKSCWLSTELYYPEIKVLATMVMPDHLHGILFVKNPMKQHLGTVIKGFKTGCNKAYRKLFPMLQPCCSTHNQKDERTHDYLWARNYNDHILDSEGELGRWFDYLRDNPRRLAMRRAYPELFHVVFGLTIGNRNYAAIGNRFLLSHPKKIQVQCSRNLTQEQESLLVEQMLTEAKHGAVLVSPAISKGEQMVMYTALEANLPLIFLTPWGFNEFSKPGHKYYEACAQGHFLILAPWPLENRRMPLTRDMCLALNNMARSICQE